MSHRSRLCAALIDVPHARYEESVRFYDGMLGQPAEVDDDDPDYASYGEVGPAVALMVQSVGSSPARVHLDIETDDIHAEVARLLALGGTEVERIKTWVVMRDPVGVLFCVVRVQSREAFEAHATTWA